MKKNKKSVAVGVTILLTAISAIACYFNENFENAVFIAIYTPIVIFLYEHGIKIFCDDD